MRCGSLFSGVGALELGLEWAGLGPTIWQVEQSDYCRTVLGRHWPNATRHRDVREVGAHNLAPVDLICGGFPCQDISGAGTGKGLAGARSGLWYEFARIVEELKPTWVVVENVASGASRWVDAVRGELERQGYETLPIPISARAVGAPHLRRRVFIVAHAKGQRSNPGRLPERAAPAVTDAGVRREDAPHPIGELVRDERERGPRGRPGELCPQGHPEPAHPGPARAAANALREGRQGRLSELNQGRVQPAQHDSGSSPARAAADPDLRGCQGEREQAPSGQQSAPGCEPGGCRCPQAIPAGASPTHGGWTLGPPVCGVDDGTSTRLDRDRLRALGNAVVPQCAQVVGEVIQALRGMP